MKEWRSAGINNMNKLENEGIGRKEYEEQHKWRKKWREEEMKKWRNEEGKKGKADGPIKIGRIRVETTYKGLF